MFFTVSGKVRISRTRWLKAQKHERAFWRRLGSRIANGAEHQLDWYGWRAGELNSWLVPVVKKKAGRVLEIGSGPIGIVSFLGWGECYAIDPLEPFYQQQKHLIALRSPNVMYLAGRGEHLPIADDSVSLVILDNVIDHTYRPGRILEEIGRVLAPDGTIYLCVNVHKPWGALLHGALAAVRIDKRHPHTFTRQKVAALLARHRFAILRDRIEDYEQVKATNRQSKRVTDLIKSWTGLSELRYEVLAVRNSDSRLGEMRFADGKRGHTNDSTGDGEP
jgi:SAM-dependent methyltransferase